VHRCGRDAPPEVKAINFNQSAQILAEVGKSLVDAGLIQHNKLKEIVWAIQTKYARDIWDRQVTPEECAIHPRPANERGFVWRQLGKSWIFRRHRDDKAPPGYAASIKGQSAMMESSVAVYRRRVSALRSGHEIVSANGDSIRLQPIPL
jgi:hypothetical protein